MSTLERAIVVAAEAHAGQLDKAGAPYVLHPLRVMLRLSSTDERIVATLHDVGEDCPGWTLDRLRGEGFPDHIIEVVRSVIKRDFEDYEAFVQRAAAYPIGRRVKLADRVRQLRFISYCDAVRARPPSHREVPASNRPDRPASR
jgi:(p)ppGpp synthase/HD superfamily hydrolase